MNKKLSKIRAIILSAGIGRRFGSPDKVFIELEGKPLFIWSAEIFEKLEEVDYLWIVTRKEMIEKVNYYLNKFNFKKVEGIVEGGLERQDSVYNALKSLPEDTNIVLIHDAARPLLSKELVIRLLNAINSHIDGVIPVISINDTIKWIKRRNVIGGTLNRDILKAVQTPQIFWFERIMEVYKKAYEEGFYGTDDASLIERYGGTIIAVQGEESNIKITTKDDFKKIQLFFKSHQEKMNSFFNSIRIGIGYDSHRLVEGRKLIIGGVEIPYQKGLYGHSDGDVLIHAIIDAILGSAGLGDIGKHFPDTDPKYKNISSILLLEETLKIAKSNQIKPVWIDCTIFAEKPKMAPFIPAMTEKLKSLGLTINIKAKTNEGMGFIGRQEGIASHAICLSRVIF
ncbi:MAG: bifunctional 2-C-methyl-D-erythritol 4-phosphate cytidylyltransferase/2-C-methyl-D-erythritol 2,4-cyclodiphosphate synthase [Thermodesulfovibrio sp.]|uniref:bifunctional 2-C-methyl-D-erythritol 4-phosphate cytidylyltransferase/2-C-methyl-D-erythritol 2,4-cyclodiphosphate synthase n=1 Tax=unclassified Thermodesulfovibrio TaxID=2645936 RepID=UPI00083A274F|nr:MULTISPECIES: bifunctional 2-C-methyl-D-erythritol 4-phosphate cytidylyltransferase/2-C-methyl-D-erythritol 2,4-cyclodiphosphate synthase [unclassified Thermodesulfovibrio]MDI1472161.1 bifunctional 2-C-methyl-D-erythritol 4-phosphate cytidylyltransferase/2-C-methyl-D-erythritol 2,4-cyclodiphosphate synthase [Thermodesulfovibrio sp. 1176]MDI6715254.1 bifunctional 2-C-methyl-D-erythritol 4-phosphate cytidylyltransferase/2-C-methyl-D-erythritol 2,4-cyclodiphosphate synthase [Thermodesulfovibrio s